jgi:hypothetical protein
LIAVSISVSLFYVKYKVGLVLEFGIMHNQQVAVFKCCQEIFLLGLTLLRAWYSGEACPEEEGGEKREENVRSAISGCLRACRQRALPVLFPVKRNMAKLW